MLQTKSASKTLIREKAAFRAAMPSMEVDQKMSRWREYLGSAKIKPCRIFSHIGKEVLDFFDNRIEQGVHRVVILLFQSRIHSRLFTTCAKGADHVPNRVFT